jgi:putative DNA primase/helicase
MKRGTDFNDLYRDEGPEAVRTCIEAATEPDRGSLERAVADTKRRAPQPLTATIDPRPYPVDALPGVIGEAVAEVQGFAQAPFALVASCALSAISVAVQAHHDIERAPGLSGPAALFLLTIANSGERKSTCDGYFTRAIRAYQDAVAEAAKPEIRTYNAALATWEAKYAGLKDRIKSETKGDKPTRVAEKLLRELEDDKPEAPRVPRLLYADATPEALGFNLATKWPSGAIVSDEAGAVFGAHGMGKESLMRNLAQLNQLWDGKTMIVDRKSVESFVVKGARLTVALQVQESTLQSFFEQAKGLARGSGFLARFLVASPQSTQGYRPFKDAPNWGRLDAFNRHMTDLLNQPAPLLEDGSLNPAVLTLAPEAGDAWRAFHDHTEAQLRVGGNLFDVRDVASKIADNAARLATLFHVFEGNAGPVSLDAFERAAKIADWHLHESRRFFGELALPVELANAARLDAWLLDYCRRERTYIVPMSEVQKSGPNGIRTKAAIEATMVDLAEKDRAWIVRSGRAKFIKVNEVLLTPAAAVPAVPAAPNLREADRTARTAKTATATFSETIPQPSSYERT